MAFASQSKKSRKPPGGQVGMRGYLVQTLIALLDVTLADRPFKSLTLEPGHESEQFDLVWEDAEGHHAMQVKSTDGQFAKAEVEQWAAKLEASGAADEYRLRLVGLYATSLAKVKQVGRVVLDKKNLDLKGFRAEAANELDRLLRREGLDPGSAEDREMLADVLTARLAIYSTSGKPLSRTELLNLLKVWVAEAPTKAPQIARTHLPLRHLTDLLEGREQEFSRLDAAWNGSEKKNIVTIVAWGGVGKTSLAVHWKNKLLGPPNHSEIERYFDWSFYSQGTRREGDTTGASHIASADLFLKEALEFFGAPVLAASKVGASQKGERLAQLIGQHRTLLILDGLEPLQDAKTGELRDDGLRALLRGLAAHNHGLCLVTTRQHLPELAPWHQTTAPEWELARLTDEAGAALLTKLGVNGADPEKRDLSGRVKGHALTLTLLGRYLKRAHHGDIRRVDRMDFQTVNEKEQGGHAFRVIAAYERWFEENNCQVELAILRMLGLFDRPATPDCLAALRDPPIAGLTEALASLNEDDLNEAVTRLVELNLVEEQTWQPRCIVGYSEEEAMMAKQELPLGEPKPLESRQWEIVNRHSLDAHPLIREYFAMRLRETAATVCTSAHTRLFDYLRASVPYWPLGLDGLQPLYEAVAHGCEAGLVREALHDVFLPRLARTTQGGENPYSINVFGTYSTDLAAIRWFSKHVGVLDLADTAELQNLEGHRLRALGRLQDAIDPLRKCVKAYKGLRPVPNVQKASIAVGTLSQVIATVGDLSDALSAAVEGVELAKIARDRKWLMRRLAYVGDVLHLLGKTEQAREKFEEAESIKAELDPGQPMLDELAGYLYCDLLLAQRKASEVVERASRTLALASTKPKPIKLTIGLDSLALGRAQLELGGAEEARRLIDDAVRSLREAGTLHHIPRGLLCRALLRSVQGQTKLARADLDQAQQIAERGPMKLFMADIYLHRARLVRDKEELKHARTLIEQCGYWRRKQELEDAEEAARHW